MNDYVANEVKKLDEWARGMMCGTVFGIIMTLGLLWAIAEPIK